MLWRHPKAVQYTAPFSDTHLPQDLPESQATHEQKAGPTRGPRNGPTLGSTMRHPFQGQKMDQPTVGLHFFRAISALLKRASFLHEFLHKPERGIVCQKLPSMECYSLVQAVQLAILRTCSSCPGFAAQQERTFQKSKAKQSEALKILELLSEFPPARLEATLQAYSWTSNKVRPPNALKSSRSSGLSGNQVCKKTTAKTTRKVP